MMSRFSSAAAAALLIGVSSMNVAADGLAARFQAVSKACTTDIQSLCQGLAPGGGRVMHCLGSNYMNVSPTCRGSMAAAMNELCSHDLARLCPGVGLGSGEAESCLQQHVSELTGSCKAAADRIAAQ